MAAHSAEGIRWNLNDLFLSPDDQRIEATLNDCLACADAFATRFRPVMEDSETLTAGVLLDALKELEMIYEALGRVGSYASLLYASDTANPDYQNLEQRIEQRGTEVRNRLLFFEIQWLKFDDRVADRLIGDPNLETYRHYLQSLRRFRPHTLTEPEERIINDKDNTGRNAFGRLFSEMTSSLTFVLEREGKEENLNLSQILSLLHNPDRTLRQQAMETLYKGLSVHGQVLTFIYDTLIQDHLTMDHLRHYPHPMVQRHLFNEIDGAAVNTMMQVTESNYGLGRDYFKLKARLLGLPRLALYDQYAPVGQEIRPFPYPQAQQVILQAFEDFTPAFRGLAADFFAKHWIDAEVRNGKRGGAFCASPSPLLHPYILCNYTDNLRDVMTIAHELGHGLHGCLSRKQSYFNYDTPLTTAETASVFAEMLVFDYLLDQQTDPRAQIALLAGKLEDIFATVFRQNVLTRFEETAFAARKERRLTPELLGTLWLEVNGKYYGDAVPMPDGYRWGWSYIPHFIHSRFYCYSYVFGQLLVLALYRMYRDDGKRFVPKYLTLLEAGGSDSPEALLKPLRVDIHDPDFWQKGFQEIGMLIERLEVLVGKFSG
ncbi:MAG TPA: M3 family oligoendopeptidase [Candidatus Binatia bacterium]|nr:M3 family oligoendopeptidase [Candidatus Binatia bacterium]